MRPDASKRVPLTRERIVEAALALVDEHGVEGFNMRRLGQRLGVDPMAIYHHLPNKDAVLDGVVEHLWGGVALPSTDVPDWQACLHLTFSAVRQRLLAHPRAALLLGSRPATTPAMRGVIERLLGHLQQAGLPAADAMPLIDCLAAFTVGKVLPESVGLRDTVGQTVAPALQALTAASHPHLSHALASGYGFAPDEQFDRGLRALIAGWTKPSR